MASVASNEHPATQPVSPKLNALANAPEPTGFTFNRSPNTVASFPTNPAGGSPTSNNESPFGNFMTQGSSAKAAGGVPASFSFQPPPNNPGQVFSLKSSSDPPVNFNPSFGAAQGQQSVPSFTVTPSTQKSDQMKNGSSSMTFTNSSKPGAAAFGGDTSAIAKKNSDPPTPISEQSSAIHQAGDESDVPETSAAASLLAKKTNTKLRDSHALVVDRSDPTSPLYSLKSFEELSLKPDLLKGIYNMGFQKPSKIQEIVLPKLLANPPQNIIAQSQSGTGKTGAFSLTIISRIDPAIQEPQAMIIAPTFELALQIGSVIEQMARFLPYIRIAYAIRQTHMVKRPEFVRGQLLSESIVIGTPGTIEEWCNRRKAINLSRLRMFCIDEADVMIDTEGFQKACVDLVKNLNKDRCQMMLFSATYSDEVMNFAREIVPNPSVLRLKREKQTLKNIRQYYIRCYDENLKYAAIEQIYASLTVGQAMIFCRTKATARALNIRMANDGHSVRELTGALDIEQRAQVITNFRGGLFRVLISTNVTSRGIDIEDVSLVINYDMPVDTKYEPDYETYLHRIGRCGRFGKLGHTFNLIGSEKELRVKEAIESYFQTHIDELSIDQIYKLAEDEE